VGIDAQIEGLEELATLDAEIKDLTEKLDKERTEIEGVRAALAQIEQTLQTDRASLAEMEKTRGELQQDLRNIGQQLERSRDRLQRSRNEREVQAAERELDELRKLQRDRDEELNKLAAVCEQARSTIQDNEQKRSALDGQLSSSEEGALSRIAQLEQQVAGKKSGRGAVTAKLPSLIARRYESMHTRGKLPVAKTTDGTCLGCYVQLPPMLFHSLLSRTQFGECPNCHRILWYQPPPSAASESASAQSETSSSAGEASGDATDASEPEQASSDAPS
jgi:predicted  nucleic acid-binding Zn-ribbon protein